MKIAFVNGYYLPAFDGPAQVTHELASRYVKQGHEVHVFTSDLDKYKRLKPRELEIDCVKVHRCFTWGTLANFSTIFPSVFFRLLKGNFDIIHTHVSGHMYHFLPALASRIKKIPHVHTTHCLGNSGKRSKFANFLVWIDYKTILPWSFKMTDKIIAITPWELKYIQKFGGDSFKIRVIRNGVSGIFFKRIQPNQFKEKYHINGKIVLFFGRLDAIKGPEILAEVGKQIVNERDDVNFVFLGPDEGKKEEVKQIISGVDRMYLFDPIRDRELIAEMYQAADVYCLPSYREGLPLTLFEAMAAGLPIVASPVNGIPYEMKEPENGFLVEYGDKKCLKKSILNILDDEKLAKEMRKNNIEKAKRYNWDIIADEYMEVYKSLVKKK